MVALTLANPGFESGVITGWTSYSTGTNNLTVPAANARTGTYAADIGALSGTGIITGAYQDVTLPGGSVGETVDFRGYVQQRASLSAATSRLKIEFYDSGSVIIGSAATNDIDPENLFGANTYGLQSLTAVVPSGAVTVRFKFENERGTSSVPRLVYDDFSASVTTPAVDPARVTTVALETLYNGDGTVARTTFTALEAAYSEDGASARSSYIGLEVLRSTSGVRTPTVMLIPGGWDPEGPPIPATVIDPD